MLSSNYFELEMIKLGYSRTLSRITDPTQRFAKGTDSRTRVIRSGFGLHWSWSLYVFDSRGYVFDLEPDKE